MERMSHQASRERRWKFPGCFALAVLLLAASSTSNSANAQSNERTATAERSFRTAMITQVAEAAQKARVTLVPGAIAYAGGDGGFVVNAAIQGVDRLDPQALTRGTDLLFVYIGARGFAVPEGFYKVRLTGNQAQFIGLNGQVSASLPANVAQGTNTTTARPTKVQISAGWNEDGFFFDLVINFGRMRGSSVTIHVPAT